jgi:Tfp pilus assembly protein PilN
MSVDNQKKYHINLLQDELLPEKVLLTLSRVASMWFVLLLLMIAWLMVSKFSQERLTTKLQTVQQTNTRYSNELDTLTTSLNNRKVDSELAARLGTIKLLMINKQALHAELTNPNKTYVAGFAAAMNELSQMHRRDIRLQAIHLSNDQMTFSGIAQTPEAVPAWLAGFENSLLLSGKSFEHFKLSENEQNITEFMVSSTKEKGMLP